MAKRNLSRTDASDYERTSLEYILDKERLLGEGKQVSVDEAIKSESLYEVKSERDETRVLFISRDESLLNPTQQSLDGYTNIADLFDEVHILILRQGIPTKTPVLRVADNVWLYTATDPNWWATPLKGKRLAIDQLVFAEGLRADLIVARDPFESAVLALWLGKKFSRPVQIHVLENYASSQFKRLTRSNFWRSFLPRFTLKNAVSVRTATKYVADFISKKFGIIDVAKLPRLNNYEALIKVPPSIELRERYKPFVFIMLYVGKLGYDSAFYRALDAARFGLRNPHLGLIALGDGSARKEFEKRAEILEVRNQVVFESSLSDMVAYMKSANVLIVPDTTPESEEIVLRGAAAGIPLIIARTPTREDIFMDGESALLCDPNSTDEFSIKLNILMNDVLLRRQMVESAQAMIKAKFHEDPKVYQNAYRTSIEQVFFAENVARDNQSENN